LETSDGAAVQYTYFADVRAEVEVPSDGTLSRVLHRDDDVRMVAFAFDRGQELTEHTAAVPAIVQVLSGRLDALVGGDRIELGPGGWLHLPARLAHSVIAVEPTVMTITMLRGSGG
jgi:quercetin dioxygenase-like cupin family protein